MNLRNLHRCLTAAFLLTACSILAGVAGAQSLAPYGSAIDELIESGPGVTLSDAAAAVELISGILGPPGLPVGTTLSCVPLPPGEPCVPGTTSEVTVEFIYCADANAVTGSAEILIEYSEVQSDCTVKRKSVQFSWEDVSYLNLYQLYVALHPPSPETPPTEPDPAVTPTPSGYQGVSLVVAGECIYIKVVVWGGVVYTGAQFFAAASPSAIAALIQIIAGAWEVDPLETCFHWGTP